MDTLASLRKKKRKCVVALSAGRAGSGIQCVYFESHPTKWELVSHAFVPYAFDFQKIVEQIQSENPARIALPELADLHRRAGLLYAEAASTALSQAPARMRRPDVGVLNRFLLWRTERAGRNLELSASHTPLGDIRDVAVAIGAPTVADFARSDIIRGGRGELPLGPGFVRIARGNARVACFLNVGQVVRAVVVNTESSSTTLDSDAGPGTCLLNRASSEAGLREGFDRDGTQAARGTVDSDCLEVLAADEIFKNPPPSTFTASAFYDLLSRPCLEKLTAADRIATLTALTARRAWAFLKRECRLHEKLERVWVCGGGAHNNTLIDHLRVYGAPVPVGTIEELGIHPDSCVPLALGLSTVGWLEGRHGVGRGRGSQPPIGLGTIVLPC
jgi:anhydro-N-acetylmuramic acid kinase